MEGGRTVRQGSGFIRAGTADGCGDENFISFAMQVGRAYRQKKQPNKALEIYQSLLERFPDDEQSIQMQGAIARTHLELGNLNAAAAAIDVFLNRYTGPDVVQPALVMAAIFRNEYHDPGKALAIYGRLMTMYPDSEQCIWIQGSIATAYLEMGAFAQAGAAADELIAKYADKPDFVKQVNVLGGTFRKYKQYAKAIELQKYVLSLNLSSEQVLPAMAELAAGLIFYQDFVQAAAAEEVLKRDYAGQKELAGALNVIAEAWKEVGQYDRAIELYQQVRRDAAGTKDDTLARVGTALVYYALGQDDWVLAEADGIVADANALPSADWAVYIIGEEYFKSGEYLRTESNHQEALQCYSKSLEVWTRILDSMQGRPHEPEAYLFSGICYDRLDDYPKAIEYFQKVVSDWPQYIYTEHAQLMIGRCYQHLRSAYLQMDAEQKAAEAEDNAARAYQNFIEKYPESKYRVPVLFFLGLYFMEKGKMEEAALYLEQCASAEDQGDYLPVMACFIAGQCYERMGEGGQAREMYRQFIKRAAPSDPRLSVARQRIDDVPSAEIR